MSSPSPRSARAEPGSPIAVPRPRDTPRSPRLWTEYLHLYGGPLGRYIAWAILITTGRAVVRSGTAGARRIARAGGRAYISIDDLILWCLESEDARDLLRTVGVDPDEYRAALSSRLSEIPRNEDRSGPREEPEGGTSHAVARALSSLAGRKHSATNPITAKLSRAEVLAWSFKNWGPNLATELLIQAGASPIDLLRTMAHGAAAASTLGDHYGSLAAVVVYNDCFTTQEFVTHVFSKILGLAPDVARERMLHVHTRGRAVVWEGPRDEAESLVNRILEEGECELETLLAKVEPLSRS